MLKNEKNDVLGLRDVGEYKCYRRRGVYYISHKSAGRLRRVRCSGVADAERLSALPKSDFAASVEQRLQAAKFIGSPAYYEVKNGR